MNSNNKNSENTEQVLQEIENLGENVFLPIVGRKKGALLESLVRKKRPEKILEIGTLVGFSAILMARNLKKGKIIGIELYQENAELAKRNIEKAGLSHKVRIIIGNALSVLKKLKEKFDFVFIDAAKEEYISYLKLLEKNKNLNKNCIIVADNAKIFAKEMADYLLYVRNSSDYQSKFHDFGNDGMEVSVKVS